MTCEYASYSRMGVDMQESLKRERAKKIKTEMLLQGVTYKDLSSMTGYTVAHLSRVVNGHVGSNKTQKAISFALGKLDLFLEE